MNDLRYDQDAADAATHAKLRPVRGYSVVDDWVLRHHPAAVMPVESLRTVPMPDLRSASARTLDAAARDLPPQGDAELAALRLAVQELRQAVDEQARTIAELTAYIRDHSEADE